MVPLASTVRVAVIGAGLGGVAAAVKLKQAGFHGVFIDMEHGAFTLREVS